MNWRDLGNVVIFLSFCLAFYLIVEVAKYAVGLDAFTAL